MLNIIQIPPINPLKFYWQSDVLNTSAFTYAAYKSFNPNQNDRGIDKDFFYRNLRSWVDKVKYFQPWQQGDKIVLQFLGVENYTSPAVAAYKLFIVDELGNTVKEAEVSQGAEVGTGSGIFIRHITMLLNDVPEGKYLVQLQKVGLFGDYDYFFPAEPIEVKAYHKNTMLIRYSHSENAYGIFWETGIEMWIRVHAAFTKLQPESKFNVYDNDVYDATFLSGVKYRNWQLTFGVGNKPMPIHLLDKLEEVLLCDNLYIEDILYTRPENSSLELVAVEKSPLLTANVALREKINNNDTTVDFYPPIVLGVAPTSEWFSVKNLQATSPGFTYNIEQYFNGTENFVSFLNASNIIGTVDCVNTYFAIDALSRIVLLTNVDAVYTQFSAGLVYENLLQGHLIVDIDTTLGTDLVVEFDNTLVGITSKYSYFFEPGSMVTGSGTTNTRTHAYAAGKKFKAFLFWDQVHILGIDTSDQILKSIAGALPYRLSIFSCGNNQIENIENNLFLKMGGFATSFDFTNNYLNKYCIDNIIRWVYDALEQFDPVGAGVYMDVQNPPAGPSVDPGFVAIVNTINNAGISLYTD